ncbi:hypothetical protein GCM10009864_26270 [Streptomyces lunalinharesii]|uniref:Uncharacterized protein n=1 Tax=Streptomyces lunalinharesii TaxID=333384 RepID=A0ABN3RQI2_9ACTN
MGERSHGFNLGGGGAAATGVRPAQSSVATTARRQTAVQAIRGYCLALPTVPRPSYGG